MKKRIDIFVYFLITTLVLGIAQTSNFYYQAATALAPDTYSWSIDLPAGVAMPVVILYQ